MNFTKNRTVSLKKLMAVAGLIWFVYLIFHLFSVLTFHSGEAVFTGFNVWLQSSILYPILLGVLLLTLSFHVVTAVSRQLSNNVSSGDRYKKPYPKAVPRIIAWSGATIILLFIVIHSFQMLTVDVVDLYGEIERIFRSPHYWAMYGLGMIAISTHLHHGLTNALQTLGISSKQRKGLALSIVVLIMAGFISIPIGVLYA